MNNKMKLTFVLALGACALTSCGPTGTDSVSTSTTSTGSGKYTYNSAVSGNPNTWNPHEWETNDDSIILGFTTSGLYEFKFNDKCDGYRIDPEMAAADPSDDTINVTPAERLKYGCDPDAESGIKWTVDLVEAEWEDGTPIKAEDYVYSMEKILNPDMMNYRANSYYNGSVVLGNAKKYYDGGHDIMSFWDAQASSVDGKKWFSFFEPLNYSRLYGAENEQYNFSFYDWLHYDNYKSSFEKWRGQEGVKASCLEKLESGEWGTVQVPMWIDITNNDNYQLVKQYADELMEVTGNSFPDYDKYFAFKKTGQHVKIPFAGTDTAVGIVAEGEYTLAFYLQAPCTLFDFKYSFSSTWLVDKTLYEANYTEVGSLTKTKYGTSMDTWKSFGPYKLTSYQEDKGFHFTRNENYYGYGDPSKVPEGEYQCTDVDIQVVPAHATQMLMFEKGELDDISLEADDMVKYGSSSRICYEPNTYTSKVTFNTDYNKLLERQGGANATTNKTIAANDKFREAFFWALDRANFCQTLTAGSRAAVVPINSTYISDVDNGTSYRSTEQGKKVITDLVGDNTTGYDLNKAKALFTEAYNEEIASEKSGHYKAGQTINLVFNVYTSDTIYEKMIKWFNDSVKKATRNTPLEGKINITKKVDADYYDTMQRGDADMIYTTWGGAQLNPYGLFDCYCDEARMFEYGFKPSETDLTLTFPKRNQETGVIELDGAGDPLMVSDTMTYSEWALALDGAGGTYSAAKAHMQTRLDVMGELELALCKQYRFVSLYARSSAYLNSFKFEQGVDEYVSVMGYGGIRYYTFNYDDAQWAEFIANNTLDYRR